ncbi:MAG: ATP/GTP-binding protein [Chloroflexota bacterium]
MSLRGNLNYTPLIDLVWVFRINSITGKLVLLSSPKHAILWFYDGHLFSITASSADDPHSHELDERVFFDLLTWQDVEFYFLQHNTHQYHVPQIIRSSDWLILEAFRNLEGVMTTFIPNHLNEHTILRLAPKTEQQGEIVNLNMEEWQAVAQIASRASIAQIATAMGYSIDSAYAIVQRLMTIGLVEEDSVQTYPATHQYQWANNAHSGHILQEQSVNSYYDDTTINLPDATNLKIVVTGTYGVGKSQFVQTASEQEFIDNDVPVSRQSERGVKNHTTTAFDFGVVTLAEQCQIQLYGTPGQERFDFLREELLSNSVGYIILVDSCHPDQIAETAYMLQSFTEITHIPFIVAANKQDQPGALSPEYIRHRLGIPNTIPVLGCVATDSAITRNVLATLLHYINYTKQHPGPLGA